MQSNKKKQTLLYFPVPKTTIAGPGQIPTKPHPIPNKELPFN